MQERKRTVRKILVRYATVTAFCGIFSIIYNHFSHGIHSVWMSGLAAWPFILGLVPAVLLNRILFPAGEAQTGDPERNSWGRASEDGHGEDREQTVRPQVEILKDVYRFGIAAVTAASCLKGVLEIAGTGSVYPDLLLYAGFAMLIVGAGGVLFPAAGSRKK